MFIAVDVLYGEGVYPVCGGAAVLRAERGRKKHEEWYEKAEVVHWWMILCAGTVFDE
jgi:hypothetical protein